MYKSFLGEAQYYLCEAKQDACMQYNIMLH